tara:strand:- start:2783 stop:2995 length:213 start_codon:yes stop_codon:yes gene_type:complete
MEPKNFKSKYFKLTHSEFTKEDIMEAISDLERFKKNFERSIETKSQKKEREKEEFRNLMENAGNEGWENP